MNFELNLIPFGSNFDIRSVSVTYKLLLTNYLHVTYPTIYMLGAYPACAGNKQKRHDSLAPFVLACTLAYALACALGATV